MYLLSVRHLVLVGEGDQLLGVQVLSQEIGQWVQRRNGNILQYYAGEGQLCGAFHLTKAVKRACSIMLCCRARLVLPGSLHNKEKPGEIWLFLI